MCTSLTYQTADQIHFLARTMDFGFELEGRPVAIPRNYMWKTKYGENQITRYAFVGAGRDLEGFFLADGVNEHGLCICELYHANQATYNVTALYGRINLAPFELPMWILGEIKTVAELRKRSYEINLLNLEIELLGEVPPLHYIIMDSTGETIVIEVENGVLVVKENPVGVMTNSPALEWHLTNLDNYVHLQPSTYDSRMIGTLHIKPFGQGSGTFGLPGGYTSPERFVRTVYHKYSVLPADGEKEGLNTVVKILNSVTIPKGAVVKADGSLDYTQYRAILNGTDKTYYFNPYGSNEIFGIKLTSALVHAKQPKEFTIREAVQIQYLT